jgi:hypothetical protein
MRDLDALLNTLVNIDRNPSLQFSPQRSLDPRRSERLYQTRNLFKRASISIFIADLAPKRSTPNNLVFRRPGHSAKTSSPQSPTDAGTGGRMDGEFDSLPSLPNDGQPPTGRWPPTYCAGAGPCAFWRPPPSRSPTA